MTTSPFMPGRSDLSTFCSDTSTGNIVTGNAYTGGNLASSAGILVVGGPCFGPGLAYTTDLNISQNTLGGNDVGVWLFNANESCAATAARRRSS